MLLGMQLSYVRALLTCYVASKPVWSTISCESPISDVPRYIPVSGLSIPFYTAQHVYPGGYLS